LSVGLQAVSAPTGIVAALRPTCKPNAQASPGGESTARQARPHALRPLDPVQFRSRAVLARWPVNSRRRLLAHASIVVGTRPTCNQKRERSCRSRPLQRGRRPVDASCGPGLQSKPGHPAAVRGFARSACDLDAHGNATLPHLGVSVTENRASWRWHRLRKMPWFWGRRPVPRPLCIAICVSRPAHWHNNRRMGAHTSLGNPQPSSNAWPHHRRKRSCEIRATARR
jgi:hypothetical protein